MQRKYQFLLIVVACLASNVAILFWGTISLQAFLYPGMVVADWVSRLFGWTLFDHINFLFCMAIAANTCLLAGLLWGMLSLARWIARWLDAGKQVRR